MSNMTKSTGTLAVLFMISATTPAILSQECGSLYVDMKIGCYFVPEWSPTSDNNTVNWWEAAEYCRAIGGHLLAINTPMESATIRGFLKHARLANNYYIGGYDYGHEGRWFWEYTMEAVGYFDWAPGQPDGGEDQNCLSLSPTNQYLWNDDDCVVDPSIRKYSFVCEQVRSTK